MRGEERQRCISQPIITKAQREKILHMKSRSFVRVEERTEKKTILGYACGQKGKNRGKGKR